MSPIHIIPNEFNKRYVYIFHITDTNWSGNYNINRNIIVKKLQ